MSLYATPALTLDISVNTPRGKPGLYRNGADMARLLGFEPRFRDSESHVLPIRRLPYCLADTAWIRTCVGFTPTRFQDVRLRPLGQVSVLIERFRS